MKTKILGSFFLTLIVFGFAFSSNPLFIHYEPETAVQGEQIPFELNVMSMDREIYEARLFYKHISDADFKSLTLRQQGYMFYADLPTKNMNAGDVQYYFAMQAYDGTIFTYPEINPADNPLSFNLTAGKYQPQPYQNQVEIIILSPEPNDVIPQDELLIAISVPDASADIDHNRTRMLIDGIDVSSRINRDETVYYLVSDRMRIGSHNVEFKIFDSAGNLVGQKEWTFRLSSSEEPTSGFRQRTNVFIDNRYQEISNTSDNFFRAGVNFNGSYDAFDFNLRVLTSSDEGFSGQDANRFGIGLAYNFTPTTRLYINGGDMSGNYDPLSFWNRRVFGFGFGFNSSFFDLDVTAGQTANAIEGDSTLSIPGTFKETFLAVKPEFKFGRYVQWGLNLINGKEDPNSIKFGGNPTESLVLGTTLALNFDNNRIRVLSSVQASIANRDASQEVPFDSLKEKFDLPSAAESAADFLESTGFLTLSQGLAPIPNLAMQYDLYLSYFNNNFKFTYKSIDPNYVTAGNPYLLTGLKGIFINDNIRLVNNQVFLNLYFKSYTDNLSQNEAETDNTHLGASISYFPMQNLPSITLNFNNQARENNIAATDSVFYPENNSTQNIGVSSSYNFATGDVLNTATVSVNTYNRDDKIVQTLSDGSEFSNNSEFTVFTLALRNKFEFPMTSRLGFSQSNNLFGKNSSNESETNITRFYGGLEYEFERVFEDVNIRPFANFNLQQIETANIDYTRTNYNTGLYFQSSLYGALSFRFDYIDYGDQTDFQDTIITTRYDVTF